MADVLRKLLPCLAGASTPCCGAVSAAVGPATVGADSAELPDCMCNLEAFDVMSRLLYDGVGMNLENLLADCNANHGAGVKYPGSAGEECEAYYYENSGDGAGAGESDENKSSPDYSSRDGVGSREEGVVATAAVDVKKKNDAVVVVTRRRRRGREETSSGKMKVRGEEGGLMVVASGKASTTRASRVRSHGIVG